MIRQVAFIADSHFDRSHRFDECVRVHDWIASDMAERGVELCLHGGDLYDKLSQPEERTAVGSWLHRIAHRCPVLIVRGANDAVGDLRVLQYLGTPYPVLVEERSSVQTFRLGTLDLQVAAVAWPRAAEILGDESTGPLDRRGAAVSKLRAILGELSTRMIGSPGVRALLMHAMVREAVAGVGQPMVGCDVEVSVQDLLAVDAHAIFLGHIHKAQHWGLGRPVLYAGSPRRFAFGEQEEKGYAVAEFNDDGLIGWHRVATPCARMHDVEWSGPVDLAPEQLAGSEVRLRCTYTADDRQATMEAVSRLAEQLRLAGAAVIVDETLEPDLRARAPEVALASTTADKLIAFWEAKSTTPAADVQARLLEKVAVLQKEHEGRNPD